MKNMSKTTKSSLITYGLVVLAYVVAEIFMKTGHMTSLLKGLLVPLCVYAILAVSLNLTVGILGELSLGHAGFMCVGAFTSAVFTKCMMHTITVPTVRFLLALLVGVVCAGICGVLIGIPVLRLRRLSGNRNLGIWRDHQEPGQCYLSWKRQRRISFFHERYHGFEYGA